MVIFRELNFLHLARIVILFFLEEMIKLFSYVLMNLQLMLLNVLCAIFMNVVAYPVQWTGLSLPSGSLVNSWSRKNYKPCPGYTFSLIAHKRGIGQLYFHITHCSLLITSKHFEKFLNLIESMNLRGMRQRICFSVMHCVCMCVCVSTHALECLFYSLV